MDFFEHQERARRKTTLLVVYFVAAVVLIILSVYLAIAGILFYGEARHGQGRSDILWYPDVFAAVSLGTIVIISTGSLFKMAQLSSGGEVVARALGGRPIVSNTRDLDERVLLNVVEEMAIAAGTPVPRVFLLDDESAINAFAAGTSPQNAVIGVTRGTIATLSRDELQGVVAHEFSHILNGDMRLNIRLIGILNGILLIATIGYILMRTSSSRSSNNKKGNPLPLVGICLYAIGYIGVFFGHLIKSAVSRQREFLADASAVQFTRLPDGISGALKKIGGFVSGSRLKTPSAEEASHMFFGNGLANPFVQLMATHPPLVERIRRIDPTFNGRFEPTTPAVHTPQDLVDPHTLAARLAGAQGVHAAAVAGVRAFASAPAAAVAQVGAPRPVHLEYAASLIASLPAKLASAVQDPLGAAATVYALLLDNEEPDVRRIQLEYLASKADPGAHQETLRLAPFGGEVNAETKLPLVSMVMPTLASLSPKQLAAFRDDVNALIKADKKVSLFEYAVHRLVQKRLLPRLERKQPAEARFDRLASLASAVSGLLSTLAHSGTRDENQAVHAFELGVEKLQSQSVRVDLLARHQCGLKVVDTALDQLAVATPRIKKRVIEACAACICADHLVTVEEGELLRVISDALDCPMPPLLDSKQ
jgi:Zn-dependent protease with chaperone function